MKILIMYATVSGNSAMLAEQLKDKVQPLHADAEFVYKDAEDCHGEDYSQYDLVIFASSTWDEGNMSLVTEDYLDQLKGVEGKKFALIGLGDSSYPHFCTGTDKVADKLKELGAVVVGDIHKIDGFIEEDKVNVAVGWADNIIKGLK